MCILPKSDDMNKMWLRSKRCFSLVRVLIKAWLRDKISFFFFWLNCNPIHFTWKFAGTVFASTENWVENIPKTSYEFFRNLENYSQVPLSTWKTRVYVFLLFAGLCSANVSKRIQLFAITVVSTAPSPYPGFSSDNSNHTHRIMKSHAHLSHAF